MAVLVGGTREAYSAEASDEDIFGRLAHDISECQKALDFVEKQGKRTAKEYWPNLLKHGSLTASAFNELLGASALKSDDLAELFERYDHRHSRSFDQKSVTENNSSNNRHITRYNNSYERSSNSGLHEINCSARIHPKERHFTVPSLHSETVAFVDFYTKLSSRVTDLSSDFSKQLTAKIKGISVHIGHIQARLKLRDSLFQKTTKLEKSVQKLEKKLENVSKSKTSAVEAELESTRLKSNSASAKYIALNTKLRTTLPESMLLIEEFVSSLIKWTIYQHKDTSKIVNEGLREICETYGFLDYYNSNRCHVQDGEAIMGQWEAEATPARLRIESLLFEDYEKNRGLLDEEISSENNPSVASKAWSKLTTKKEKHHEVKAKDRVNGIFHDHQMADPIKSFIQFYDPALNSSTTHNPEKMAERPLPELPSPSDGPVNNTKPASFPPPPPPPPPPLPPRDESKLTLLRPLPERPKSQFLPKTPPPTARSWAGSNVQAHQKSSSVAGNASLHSPRSESQFSSVSGGTTSNSSVDGANPESVFLNFATEKLIKLYNGSKNEITEAPITVPGSSFSKFHGKLNTVELNLTRTWQLSEIRKSYEAIRHARGAEKDEILVAKASFQGLNPGDLSFEAGEKVEMLLDLQKYILTYEKSGKNWFLGASVDSSNGHRRVGFAPNTFFR